MPFCIECGNELGESDAFCIKCGAKQQPTPEVPEKVGEPKEAVPKNETEPAEEVVDQEAAPTPLPKVDQKDAAKQVKKSKTRGRDKPKKKGGCLKKLIVLLVILGAIGGGMAYGYSYIEAELEKQNKKMNIYNMTDYLMEMVGLEKRDDTDANKEGQDTDTDEEKNKEDTDEDKDPTSDKTFWYDANGDIEDKDGRHYLKMYTNKDYYYQPDSKKIYLSTETELNPKTLDVKVFWSSKYGIMIVFPKGWKDLQTQVETQTDRQTGEKMAFIEFMLPTTDKDYQTVGKNAVIFGIMVISTDYYDELRNDPDAYSDAGEFIGKFGDYGYIAYADGGYPDDLEKRVNELVDVFDYGFTFHEVE